MVITSDYLFKCLDCGESFFTSGEKAFYEEKGLTIPTRCKKCRELRKLNTYRTFSTNVSSCGETQNISTSNIYDEIIENWSVDAKKERSEYFYNIEEVETITSGKKSFVIGRKGSGKTAIAQYLCEIKEELVFTQKLSFKNFPFNILYSLDNRKEYTQPNQYISIWKYLIYTYICKKMISNQNINIGIRDKLTKLYGDSSITSLNQLLEKWTSKSFGFQVFGSGLDYEREKQKSELTWIDTINILENIILEHCDSSKYLIVFDELDEDYKDFQTSLEYDNYTCMLTSLYKAVQDIRSIFDSNGQNIYPVVFLRSDIYSRLKDSDKNKWSESIIDMEWDSDKIQRMLAHRLSVAYNLPETDFKTVWNMLFSRQKVRMGNKQMREMDNFSYIERSTEMRPRDFIKYVKECVIIAKKHPEVAISPKSIKDADDNFSEYLKAETIDEIFPVLPEISDILGLLSTIRKQSFRYDAFNIEYNKLLERGFIVKRDVKNILLILFDAGVIGNQPSMRGKAIFRFSAKSPRFNFNETMIIHRGLYKALQIY